MSRVYLLISFDGIWITGHDSRLATLRTKSSLEKSLGTEKTLEVVMAFSLGPATPCQMFCHLSINSLTELQGLFITEKRAFWPMPRVPGPGPCGSGMKGEDCHLMQRCKSLDHLPVAGNGSSCQASPSRRLQCFCSLWGDGDMQMGFGGCVLNAFFSALHRGVTSPRMENRKDSL